MDIEFTEEDEQAVRGEIITDEKLYFSYNKEDSLKVGDHRWAHCHFTVLGTGKAGHLPGIINQGTIWVEKAVSDSEIP